MLGDQRTKEQVRRFNRPPLLKGEIQLDAPRWVWLISQASQAVNKEIDPSGIYMAKSIRCPALELYNRRWIQENKHTGKKKRQTEMFESIKAGAVLTYECMTSDEPDPALKDDPRRMPFPDEIHDIFTEIGDKLGISPWGSQFGYGRYELLSCEPSI